MSDRWSKQQRFEQLYRDTYPKVAAYCRRRLPADESDDAVAEIYAVAWRKADQFLGADSPLAWLYGVGFRVISSRYRSKKRRRLLTARLAREPERGSIDAGTSVATDDEVARAFAALVALSPKDQELIRLAVFEELSYEEIAEATGTSFGSVRSALFRARKRLQEAQDAEEGDRG